MANFLSITLQILSVIAVIVSIQGQCLKKYESGVNSRNQKTIIEKHNSLRISLAKGLVAGQPRACNMKRLMYDSKLAKAAQKIADTCKFAHVPVTDSRWTWIGQNLYITMSYELTKGASWNFVVQMWFNEHTQYTYPDNSNAQTGHYTQVAWANTKYVGCGYTSFESSEAGAKYQKLYVCNYGPGGNYPGEAPYETDSNGVCGCQDLC